MFPKKKNRIQQKSVKVQLGDHVGVLFLIPALGGRNTTELGILQFHQATKTGQWVFSEFCVKNVYCPGHLDGSVG